MNRFTVLTALAMSLVALACAFGDGVSGPLVAREAAAQGQAALAARATSPAVTGGKDEIAKLQADLAPANQRIKNRKAAQAAPTFAPLPGLAPARPPSATVIKWPDATTTGPRASACPNGRTASGGFATTMDNQQIKCLDLDGTITIRHTGVVIEDVAINIPTGNVTAGIFDPEWGGRPYTVRYSRIDGGGRNSGNQGIWGSGTFEFNDIEGVENGIIPYSHSKLTGNFIHALKATGSPHYDGIQMDGGQADVLITGNTVINDWGAAGAVMTNNEFGPITNVVVDGNFLKGGSFTVYADGSKASGPLDITVTNNVVEKGQYGVLYCNGTATVNWSGNTRPDGSTLVKPPKM